MKQTDRFSGKKVYITGGSSGIGLAVAEQMARAGAHVLIFARDEGRLRQAAGRIQSRTQNASQRISWCSLDVTKPEYVERTIDRMVADFGPPDILMNSAGKAMPDYFGNITADQFDMTLKLNLYGMRHMIAASLPYLTKTGGHIVNVSSVAGLIGVFGYTDYSASKFAVIGFSEALRQELSSRGITVSVLCPPDTDTPGLAAENATKPPETRAIAKTASALSAEKVAVELLRGMVKGKFLIVPGWNARMSVLIKRLWPGLVDYLLDRTIAGVSRR